MRSAVVRACLVAVVLLSDAATPLSIASPAVRRHRPVPFRCRRRHGVSATSPRHRLPLAPSLSAPTTALRSTASPSQPPHNLGDGIGESIRDYKKASATYRRWRVFRERTMDSMGHCCKMLAVSALVDLLSTCVLSPLAFKSRRANIILALETAWKVSLGVGLWLINSGNRRFAPPDATPRDRMLNALKILAFLWRKTSWVLTTSTVVNVWGTFGPASLPIAVFLCVACKLATRQMNDHETHVFRKPDNDIRTAGLLTVRNMALCSSALVLRGIAGAASAIFKSTLSMQGYHLSGLQTPFITAGLLWRLRRAFLRAVVTNSSNDDDDDQAESEPILVPEDLLEAQDTFYSTVSTTVAGEVFAKSVMILLALVRARIPSDRLAEIAAATV